MRVLNTQQMRDADRQTIDDIGLPSIVLMENAGRQAVAAMEAAFEDLGSSKVGVLCGRGNNGGDGFVVARTLAQRGIEAIVYLLGQRRRGARRRARQPRDSRPRRRHRRRDQQRPGVGAAFHRGLRVRPDRRRHRRHRLPRAADGLLETVVADVNGLGVPVVAIDLPTGVSADSHELEGEAIEASMTVTLAAPKLPLILPPADAYGGDLVIADIGIPEAVIDELDGPWLEILTRERMRELVPARASDSHKGDFGRVLVIAGADWPDRRRPPGGARRAAIRRRAGHDCDAAIVRRDASR